jgi:hypothetical protein
MDCLTNWKRDNLISKPGFNICKCCGNRNIIYNLSQLGRMKLHILKLRNDKNYHTETVTNLDISSCDEFISQLKNNVRNRSIKEMTPKSILMRNYKQKHEQKKKRKIKP